MKKRLLSILLCVLMLVSILPVTASAALPDISIGDVYMEADKYLHEGASTLSDSAPIDSTVGYAFLDSEGVLTLNNYTYTSTGEETYGDTICSEGALTIRLIGDNSLDVKEGSDGFGIYSDGDLKIYSTADDEGTLTIYEPEDDDCYAGLFSESGMITVSDCELNITTYAVGIHGSSSAKGIDIKNSVINITSYQGIWAEVEDISITNSDVSIYSTGPSSTPLWASDGDISIDGGEVYIEHETDGPSERVGAITAYSGSVTISNAVLDIVSNCYGISNSGYAVTTTNSTVNIQAGGCGILTKNLTVNSGTLESKSTNEWGAIVCDRGTLTLGEGLVFNGTAEPDGTPVEVDIEELSSYDIEAYNYVIIGAKTAAPKAASVTIGSTTTEYETIDAAWAAALEYETTATDKATITLLSDCTAAATLTNDKDYLVLNTGTYTLTAPSNTTGILNNGGTLDIIGDGTVRGNTASHYGLGTITINGGTVTVNGPTISNYANGRWGAGEISVLCEGGAFVLKTGDIVSGGEYGLCLEGTSSAYLYSGKIESRGGRIVATDDDTSLWICHSEKPLVFISKNPVSNSSCTYAFESAFTYKETVKLDSSAASMNIKYGNDITGATVTSLENQTSINDTVNAAYYIEIQTGAAATKEDVDINYTSPQTHEYDGDPKAFIFTGTPEDGYVVYYNYYSGWSTEVPSALGTYDIKITRAEDDTYNEFTQEIKGGLVIQGLTPAVTSPTAKEGLVYDGELQPLVNLGSSDNGYWKYYISGDTSGSETSPAAKDANTYTVRCDFIPATGYADVADVVLEVNIAKAPLTITARSYTIYIGDPIPALEYDADGLKGNDTISSVFENSLSCTTDAPNSNTAGEYDIELNYTFMSSNYNLTLVDGKLTVSEKRAISITETAQTYTYGESIAFVVSTSDNVAADSFDVEYYVNGSWTTEVPSDVGSYDVRIYREDDGVYRAFETTITDGLVIEQREVGLDWSELTAAELVYSGTAKTLTATATGLVDGDNCIVTVELLGDNINFGTFSYTATALSNQNYKLPADVSSPEYTITPKTLTITADSHEVYVGSRQPELTCTVDGLVDGDAFETLPSCTTDANMYRAGTYDIIPSGADAGNNYSITYVNGTLTVKNYPYIPQPTYDVEIADDIAGGEVSASKKLAYSGDTITITVDPDVGYELNALTVTDSRGNTVSVTKVNDSKYTFKMPGYDVEVDAVFAKIDTACPRDWTCPMYGYTDLDRTLWYHDGIHFCVEHGLMVGTGANIFEPNIATSRAMIVTILWHLEGEPVVNYAMDFEDVPAEQWYTEAIRWAASEKIVEGYGNGKFGTNDVITREQMVTIMWRYAKYKGYDVSVGENTNILSYDDAFDVAEWAIPAMQWACGSGMIQGIADGNQMNLAPQGNATRAQAAAILQRYVENVAKGN